MEIDNLLDLTPHCLHLCTNVNIKEMVLSYIMKADVFVTNDVEMWEKRFKENQVNCKIKKPGVVKSNERIVVDGSSLGDDVEMWEKKWKKQSQVVCIYNIDRLNPPLLKELVKVHNRMILSVDKIKMLSDKNLEKEINGLNPEIAEPLVKRELRNIILSMLLSKPMCGIDLVRALYQKFNVFISPGMLYPALHELEESGLLKYEYKFKSKIYHVQKEEEAKDLLKDRNKANSLLSQVLVQD